MESIDFKSSAALEDLINFYFDYLYETNNSNNDNNTNDLNNEKNSAKETGKIKSEQATFSGLAYFLGFSSMEEFNTYCTNGKYARTLRRGHLRVEEIYEKKLLQPSPAGATFVLKTKGWNDKSEKKSNEKAIVKNLKLQFVESGPAPVGSEKEITL